MKPAIFTTDLHLTDHRQEAYRFEVFNLLAKYIRDYGLAYCFILGDLTDKTDRHSAYLINTFIDRLRILAQLSRVFILRGNHDYVDPANPYFRFLSALPNVQYVNDPLRLRMDDEKVLMLPHTRHPEDDWKDVPLNDADVVFMHQTVSMAKSENGFELPGMDPSILFGCKEVYSGDVHVPQKIGNVVYVGSPYHVHFGDQFNPRFLIRSAPRQMHAYPVKLPARYMFNITSLTDFETREFQQNDQAKVIMHLSPDQWAMWPQYREQIKRIAVERGLELIDVQPQVLGTASEKSASPAFIIGQQGSKAVIERFMDKKYPNLHASFKDKGVEYAKTIDGI